MFDLHHRLVDAIHGLESLRPVACRGEVVEVDDVNVAETIEADLQDIDPSDTSGVGDATDLTGVAPTENSEADDTSFGIAAE